MKHKPKGPHAVCEKCNAILWTRKAAKFHKCGSVPANTHADERTG